MGRRGASPAKEKRSRRGLREGQSVRFISGQDWMPAEILEDRGALASRGRHVFRIAIFPDDPDQRDEFEVTEDSLEPEPRPKTHRARAR